MCSMSSDTIPSRIFDHRPGFAGMWSFAWEAFVCIYGRQSERKNCNASDREGS